MACACKGNKARQPRQSGSGAERGAPVLPLLGREGTGRGRAPGTVARGRACLSRARAGLDGRIKRSGYGQFTQKKVKIKRQKFDFFSCNFDLCTCHKIVFR